MSYEDQQLRVETFIKIKEKIDDVQDLIQDAGLGDDFMCCYCFAIMRPVEEDVYGEAKVEHMSGFSAQNAIEMHTMTQNILQDYFNSIGDEGKDSSSVDYWMENDK